MRRRPQWLGRRYRQGVSVRADRRWHHHSTVVLTALIALLTMHGLTTDHGIGIGMGSMRSTTSLAAASTIPGSTDPQPSMPSALTAVTQLRGSIVASSVAAVRQLGHTGGMCVGILGIGLLLWLLARSRRRRFLPASFGRTLRARVSQARAGPLPPPVCPSLVKLGISRT